VPRLSILLPYRDAAATLAECLASIAAQGHATVDPRIRRLVSPQPGLVAALNHGLAAARAELVVRMDADDRMHPGRLGRQPARPQAGARPRTR